MECNKDEAIRAKEFAEKKMQNNDFEGAQRIAMKAQKLFPALDNISHMLEVCHVHICAGKKINGTEMDCYGILQVEKQADEITIKKQYRRLALILHPDKNKFPGAETAFKMIGEANRVLSNQGNRSLYDSKCSRLSVRTIPTKLNPSHQPNVIPPNAQQAFWTNCPFCNTCFRYLRNVMNKALRCQSCLQPFIAYEIDAHSVPHLYKKVPVMVPVHLHKKAPDMVPKTFSVFQNESARTSTHANRASAPKRATQVDGDMGDKEKIDHMKRAPAPKRATRVGGDMGDKEKMDHMKRSPAPKRATQVDGDMEDKEKIDHMKRAPAPKRATQVGGDMGDKEKIDHMKGSARTSTDEKEASAPKRATRVGGDMGDKEKMDHMKRSPAPKRATQVDGDMEDQEKIDHMKRAPAPKRATQVGGDMGDKEKIDHMKGSVRTSTDEKEASAPKRATRVGGDMGDKEKMDHMKRSPAPKRATQVDGDMEDKEKIDHMKRAPAPKRATQVGGDMGDKEKIDHMKGSARTSPDEKEASAPKRATKVGGDMRDKEKIDHMKSQGKAGVSGTQTKKRKRNSEDSSGGGREIKNPFNTRKSARLNKTSHNETCKGTLGDDIKGVPEGCFELDPAALPNDVEYCEHEPNSLFPNAEKLQNPSKNQRKSSRKVKSTDNEPIKTEEHVVPNIEEKNFVDLTASAGPSKKEIVSFVSPASKILQEFYNFAAEKSEINFFPDEIWAMYDNDGLPKKYAQIKRIQSSPFRLYVLMLEVQMPYGTFKVSAGKPKPFAPSGFSHIIKAEIFGKNRIDIYPKAGQVWALDKSWDDTFQSSNMKNLKYEIVEVLESENEQFIRISLLLHLKGSKTVFKSARGRSKSSCIMDIPWKEVARLSYQIPSFKFTSERNGLLRGCWELDPAAIPKNSLT